MADILNAEFNLNYGDSRYRKYARAFIAGKNYERERLSAEKKDSYIEEIAEQRRQLSIERKKLQTEKIENNKWIRDYARDELLAEKIVQAIEENKFSGEVPHLIRKSDQNEEWVLAFGDAHYGKEFRIVGLDGEVINEYSPEIFEERMWALLDKTVSIVEKEKINTLNVYDLGDSTDGILRVGSLIKLKYGVVQGSIRYASFLVTWLNELTKYVRVRFAMARGNHTELRMLGQPKGTFPDENMADIISSFVEMNMGGNPNFSFVKNPTGYIFQNNSGFNVLGVHGDCGDLSKAINEFSSVYRKRIDYMIAGHAHHRQVGDVAIKRAIIGVKSIIGVDDFAMDIRRTSDAGATIVAFEPNVGDTIHYNIVLN